MEEENKQEIIQTEKPKTGIVGPIIGSIIIILLIILGGIFYFKTIKEKLNGSNDPMTENLSEETVTEAVESTE